MSNNQVIDPIPSIPPGVKLTTLENGLTIIVREDHSAPVVSAQAWCMAGSIHEGRWLGAGMSHVLEHMLLDRKSTRLNSSHTVISYAVFCLKKKKKKYTNERVVST